MSAVVYVPDLVDRSKVTAALVDPTVVRGVDDLPRAALGAAIVVVDLSRPGVAERLGDLVGGAGRVVGFAPHVEEALLERARAAGVDAMPRSVFFRDVSAAVHG